jgi:hypothetical protein
MGSGGDRAYYSGEHKAHGVNVQVLAEGTATVDEIRSGGVVRNHGYVEEGVAGRRRGVTPLGRPETQGRPGG